MFHSVSLFSQALLASGSCALPSVSLFMYTKVDRVGLANQAGKLTYKLAATSCSLYMTQSLLVCNFPECSESTEGVDDFCSSG